MKKLELINIGKSYAGHCVIPQVDLTIDNGEFVVFVGPSGCGKSTLLRMIAGLESITEGELRLNGQPLNDVHPSLRQVAMVFQSYALYPHMSVEKNMGFPLKMAGMSAREITQKVRETAENLQLTHLLDRLPSALSGGQRQRVAIGRAIVRDPELFLFDEPLSNLDAKLRGEMRIYLKQLHQNLKATMIYVTHDQVEAMTLADRIVVLNQGRIEQVGTPETLYQKPANKFVASFIGSPVMNFLPPQMFDSIDISLPAGTECIGVRPNQVVVDSQNPDAFMPITVVEPLGHSRLYYGLLQDKGSLQGFGSLQGLHFVVESDQIYGLGDRLPISLSRSTLHLFDEQEQRIEMAKTRTNHAA
ncbi:ABC transporter ATP-binding protein [Providencia sp. PROV212]|jgi:ABC-type sugar transport system ATPase subunit|uniref:ABC transporter ATP-binding protein n=1 Tax=Providencia sp. PROV212 TaxID=2949909 RepID=UPI00234A88A9|nr:sn-glycerol-3-phosphate ABC transporter ATP-binding protein UgpC [Providencia sp. PROV212]MDR2241765.1 sn-glycerol-3-phosphate ABC transporter ATP-binding protein UgpC [Providencia alcalifaciens]